MPLALLVLICCLLLPSLTLSIPLLSPSSTSTVSNSTSLDLSARAAPPSRETPPVNCNPRYGANLRSRSVRNALAKIPKDRTMYTFEMRQLGQLVPSWWKIMPYRIVSDDGLAFIEISTRNNELIDDNASWQDIRTAAGLIIRYCVSQSSAQGGRAIEVGVHHLLTVTVSRYDNRQIHCFDPPPRGRAVVPPYASCLSLLSELPWDERQLIWGNAATAEVPVIRLPLSMPSVDQKCNLFVSMRDPLYETMRWTDLWGAAVAAQEMCVKKGMIGSGVDMGQGKKIRFQLVGLQSVSDEVLDESRLVLGARANGSAIS